MPRASIYNLIIEKIPEAVKGGAAGFFGFVKLVRACSAAALAIGTKIGR
jgi:hypothetical protein